MTGTVHAVRGYLSRELILKNKNNEHLNIVGNIAVGDPAILLPLIIPESKVKVHKLGIIPHYVDYAYFKEKYGKSFHVIDLSTSDVEKITREITSCERILSTSLHGIIVSHAYNIPAIWIERNEILPGSNGFKFKDYFSTVGLDYEPFRNIHTLLNSQHELDKLFSNRHLTLPNMNLDELRKSLLRCAPFPLKKEFKIYHSNQS